MSDTPDAASRIDALYDATLKPKLEAIDGRRRHIRWLVIKSLIIVLLPVPLMIAGDSLDNFLPIAWIVPVLVIAWAWFVGGLLYVLVRNLLPGIAVYASYRSRFKQDIVAQVFKLVCPTAVYDPLQGLTPAVFDAPGLFNTRGGFDSDDRVRGKIGRTPFEAAEVGRAYTTGYGKNARSYTVFRGLFFHIDFNRRIEGVTIVDPESANSYQLGDRSALRVVTFDHPGFEKEFKVHASSEAGARALLTSAMMDALLTLRAQAGKPVFVAFKDRRAYVGVHYGRQLFEPGIARTTSKEALREVAAHFAFVETIVRELDLDIREPGAEPDESLLAGPDIVPHPLSVIAAQDPGTLTVSEIWKTAGASIDDSASDAAGSVPKPERTRIRFERGPGTLSITYGLRLGFWVMFMISLAGALLATSALRAELAPAWAGQASAIVRTLPPLPLDSFAADAPTPWLIVGSVIFVLLALMWTGYVRRVAVDPDAIRIFRGFRPFPRVIGAPPSGVRSASRD